MQFTRKDQAGLLEQALSPTGSIAWKPDAVALGGFAAECRLAVVAVFQDFSGTEAEMHLAMFNGYLMSRTIMDAFSQIAFHERFFALSRVWISIAEDNPRAQAAAIRAGFGFEYRKRGGFLGRKDAIVMAMSRPQPAPPLPGTPQRESAVHETA